MSWNCHQTNKVAELRHGAIGKNASPKHGVLVDEFFKRVNRAIGSGGVGCCIQIKQQQLSALRTIIGSNDIAIAGHAVALDAMLVTNNT